MVGGLPPARVMVPGPGIESCLRLPAQRGTCSSLCPCVTLPSFPLQRVSRRSGPSGWWGALCGRRTAYWPRWHQRNSLLRQPQPRDPGLPVTPRPTPPTPQGLPRHTCNWDLPGTRARTSGSSSKAAPFESEDSVWRSLRGKADHRNSRRKPPQAGVSLVLCLGDT